MDIKLYHDSFLQFGGAERAPIIWASSFGRKVTCFGLEPKLFSNNLDVIEPILKELRKPSTLVMLFPFVPVIYLFLTRKQNMVSEIALVSSSGLAHYFTIRANLKVLYLNTPTRWIWKKTDFEKNQPIRLKLICTTLRPIYKYLDKRNVRKFDIVISNSTNVQKQIKNIYNINSMVVYPPVKKNNEKETALENKLLSNEYFLIVARNRGYKFNNQLLALSKLVDKQIVLCGEGTEKISGINLLGLGFVSQSNLNWLYQHAKCLIGLAEEDFGLTPVEAAIFGCPTIAFDQGGYSETIMHGINGWLVSKNGINEMADMLNSIHRKNFDRNEIIESANRFSDEKHLSEIKRLIRLNNTQFC